MSAQDPSVSLPADVLILMRRTLELVDLLYWMPTTPTKGTPGEKIMASMSPRRNSVRQTRPGPSVFIERESSEGRELGEDEQGGMEKEDQDIKVSPDSLAILGRRKRRRWMADVDLETRKAYGRALMSGHGILFMLCTNHAR